MVSPPPHVCHLLAPTKSVSFHTRPVNRFNRRMVSIKRLRRHSTDEGSNAVVSIQRLRRHSTDGNGRHLTHGKDPQSVRTGGLWRFLDLAIKLPGYPSTMLFRPKACQRWLRYRKRLRCGWRELHHRRQLRDRQQRALQQPEPLRPRTSVRGRCR